TEYPHLRAKLRREESVNRTFSTVFRFRLPTDRAFTKLWTRFAINSVKAQSPSNGTICRRKCDSTDFRLLGLSPSDTWALHSVMKFFSVRDVLGTGGVA